MHDATSDEEDLSASINVTPFVDVVLVLLVIFMVTSHFVRPSAIDVKLPRAAAAGSAVAETLNIVIDRQARLYLDGEVKSEADLHARLGAARAHGQSAQVAIAADRSVDYGAVIHVIDLVKSHGIDDFALQIDRP